MRKLWFPRTSLSNFVWNVSRDWSCHVLEVSLRKLSNKCARVVDKIKICEGISILFLVFNFSFLLLFLFRMDQGRTQRRLLQRPVVRALHKTQTPSDIVIIHQFWSEKLSRLLCSSWIGRSFRSQLRKEERKINHF